MLFALLAALAYAGGSTLQSVAVSRRGRDRTARFLLGAALDVIAWALSLVALRGLPVYVVQAVLASSLAFTVVFARIWQHTALRGRDVAAIGALIPALAVIALAGREQSAPVVGPATTAYLTIFGFAAALAAAAAVGRRTPVPAVLAGLSFSATALAARAVHLSAPLWHTLQQPLVWVVVATGAAGTLAYAAALERGPVGPATAQLWAVEVVVPAVVAIPLLGDTVRPGWLPAAVLAVLVVVAVTVVLTSSARARPSYASGTPCG
jgi:drug/metabolite transporter (DMT)-like permease